MKGFPEPVIVRAEACSGIILANLSAIQLRRRRRPPHDHRDRSGAVSGRTADRRARFRNRA